ncbi:MAG: cytochrome c [Acidobacteriota bacterium]
MTFVTLRPAAYGQTPKDLNLETGEEIFQATCAGCHGPDGKGQPQHILGFEPPATFPDFTDCNGSTRESHLQWSSVIHDGGAKARAFSEIMPSFGPAENPLLTDQEIEKVIGYLRSFCVEDKKWPSGEFNFARPMFTEKSFPEDEMVLINTFNATGTPGVTQNLVIEKRFGPITNMEFRFRGGFQQLPSGTWVGTVGDTSIEFKRSLYVNNKTGTLLAFGNEATIPNGNPKRGSNGIFIWESFLSLAQVLPKKSFLQAQMGAEAPPFHRHQTQTEFYARAAFGKFFSASKGFGRTWTLANELVGTRSFGRGQAWTLDVVPYMQVTVSRRQHMRLGLGVNIPAVNVQSRQTQVIMYMLWDVFDGGLTEGWR